MGYATSKMKSKWDENLPLILKPGMDIVKDPHLVYDIAISLCNLLSVQHYYYRILTKEDPDYSKRNVWKGMLKHIQDKWKDPNQIDSSSVRMRTRNSVQ